jgi:hypothetical protein
MQEKKIRKVQKVSYTFGVSTEIVEAMTMAETGDASEENMKWFLRSQTLAGLKEKLEDKGFIKLTSVKSENRNWIDADIIVARPEKTRKGQTLDSLEKETTVEKWRDFAEEGGVESASRHLMLMIAKRYVVFSERKLKDGSVYEATAEILVAKPDEQ